MCWKDAWGGWTAMGLVRWENNSWVGGGPRRTRMDEGGGETPRRGSPLAGRIWAKLRATGGGWGRSWGGAGQDWEGPGEWGTLLQTGRGWERRRARF